MTSELRNCPQCNAPVRPDILDKLGGLCPPCVAGFVLSGNDDRGEPLPLAPGTTFRGLEVSDVIGRGGMGIVYKARHAALNRDVALKVLSPKLASDPQFASRFASEARALAALNHPNIVQVFDFGSEGDLYFLVMEYVDGVSLRRVMCERRLAPPEALRIVSEVCTALDYAHARGVVHRDVKPENILIGRDECVKIADFGLAKLVDQQGGAPSLTRSSMVLGTPHYMAPERYEKQETDHRSDIYSLGVVFYELLTGEIPMGKFEPPSKRAPVDGRLDDVVLKALERDPDQRYQRASELMARVQRLGTTEVRRRRVALVAAAVAIVACCVALVWLMTRQRSMAFPPDRAWTWTAGDVSIEGPDLVVGSYADQAPIALTCAECVLPDSFILTFRLRYEVGDRQEPWIFIIFEGTRCGLFMFPQADHVAALARQGPGGSWGLVEKHPLPPSSLLPDRWSEIEVSWEQKSGRLTFAADGTRCFETRPNVDKLQGSWRFSFSGAAREIRVRDVRLRSQE